MGDDLSGTATIPYPENLTRERRQHWQWKTMERVLLDFIDYAATNGPALIRGGDEWRWVLLPWDADQQRYDDTKGMNGFDGSVPILTAWLEDAGALQRVPADTATTLLAMSTVSGPIGYDDQPLEEQFYRITPDRMLTVYPQLATQSRVGENPWTQHAGGER